MDNTRSIVIFISVTFIALTQAGSAQKHSLSVKEVLNRVPSGQPQLQAYQEQTKAAGYTIDLAKNTFVPNLTAGYQAGYATYNNITGMSYSGLMMPITGPPSANNTYDPVPGTALSALLQWTPFTFGQRQADIKKATSQFNLARTPYDNALLRQQYAGIATYLDLVYLQKLQGSQQPNIHRTLVDLQQSPVLTQERLPPPLHTLPLHSQLV